MELTLKDRENVEKIINEVKEKENVSWYEARTQLHKFVCRGRCDWYKKNSVKAGFQKSSLTQKQKNIIETAVERFMKDRNKEKTRTLIHEYLCPGH
ncbi:MAG: hypothetical protein U9O89_07835 [Thermoproteota archaeon]|nr:hypothetical protein [Thermoproteota archaeon]